jgi:DNA polymerase
MRVLHKGPWRWAWDKLSPPKVTIDFETRSEIDLTKVGAWKYAAHPSTDALCLTFKIGDGPVQRWHSPLLWAYGLDMLPDPEELFDAIEAGAVIEAHNAGFERAIWTCKMVPDYGWPAIKRRQWKCSAAKAASYALPRALEGACQVMRTKTQKDADGHRIMKELCKPRKPTKDNPHEPYVTDREKHQRNVDYCATDTQAEYELSLKLPDLNPDEYEVWQVDQTINERGVFCDVALARLAVETIAKAIDGFNAEIEALTGGKVTKTTQRERVLKWLRDQHYYDLGNTQGPTLDVAVSELDEALMDVFSENFEDFWRIRRVIWITRAANKTSTAKFKAMLDRIGNDHRIRDTLLYMGASKTGRWSGRGVQLQNIKRGGIEDMEKEVERILGMSLDDIIDATEDVVEMFSQVIRGAICAPPGKELVVADYASIEARGTFWLADCVHALNIFTDPKADIYCDLARSIYHREITKKDKDERQLGKKGILGCGYGMGKDKFHVTCAKDGLDITKEMAETVVKTYRETYPEVPELWNAMEEAALQALENKKLGIKEWVPVITPSMRRLRAQGKTCPTKIHFKVNGRFLFMRLPSGRLLGYPDPSCRMAKTPWGGEKLTIFYWGMDQYTHQWAEQKTYGGKLVENAVQAISRDIMAAAMVNIENNHPTYLLVLSVHDELVSEVDEGKGDVKEFEGLLTKKPPWAEGFPLAAEGWRGKRYRK